MNSKKIVLASALVAGCLITSQAQAQSTTVTVSGVSYTISATSTSSTYSTSSSMLQATPWWGNASLAQALATAVGTSLGAPNYGTGGAVFLYGVPGITGSPSSYVVISGTLGNPTLVSSNSYYWAILSAGGTSTVDLTPNAIALRGAFNLQSAALNAGLSYDCTVFDAKGICLSTGGRYTASNVPDGSTTSGLLIGSFKYSDNIRLGAWADQNISAHNPDGIKLGNSNPLIGVFGTWSERTDGLGHEVKFSAGYGDKDLEVTRTSTNIGSAQFRMRGIQTVYSHGFAVDAGMIASPYAGIKYASIERNGYTEGGTGALAYEALHQETTTAVAGARLSGKINPQTTFMVSAGIEHDLNHNVDNYIGGSNSVVFNSNVQKTRPTASAGIQFEIDKTQRIGATLNYRKEAFQSTATTSAMLTYTIGM